MGARSAVRVIQSGPVYVTETNSLELIVGNDFFGLLSWNRSGLRWIQSRISYQGAVNLVAPYIAATGNLVASRGRNHISSYTLRRSPALLGVRPVAKRGREWLPRKNPYSRSPRPTRLGTLTFMMCRGQKVPPSRGAPRSRPPGLSEPRLTHAPQTPDQ